MTPAVCVRDRYPKGWNVAQRRSSGEAIEPGREAKRPDVLTSAHEAIERASAGYAPRANVERLDLVLFGCLQTYRIRIDGFDLWIVHGEKSSATAGRVTARVPSAARGRAAREMTPMVITGRTKK